jgi:dynein intermediate chain 1
MTKSSVTALAFHPRKTSILSVGMANGVVAVYDVAKSEELMLFRSEINDYFHIDRVTTLEWVPFKINKNMKIVLMNLP